MITPTSTVSSNLKAEYNIRYILIISFVAAMGGLLFGYDWVVIAGAKQFFEPFFGIQNIPKESGWANSCALIGCLIGALASGALSDKFGRKRLLILSALIFIATSLGNAFAVDFNVFISWRILGGVAIGLASGLSPMYISEIAPAQMRGRLVAINQLTIVVGILLSQYVNWFIGRNLPEHATDDFIVSSWYGQECWRWMFGLTAVPALLFFVGMFFVPESPRWLAKKGRREGARGVLAKIGGANYAATALGEIESTLVNDGGRVRFRELLDGKMFRVLALGVFLGVFQQWCGINVIFNYAENIFKAAGFDISKVLQNIAWTGSVNLVFTVVAFFVVDRVGRRPLMLFGAGSLALVYFGLGFGYHVNLQGTPMLVLVLTAIACYSMSLAPVTWVVISEIFPNRIRGAAVAVAVASLWAACFVLTYTFPLLVAKFGPAKTFALYAVICVLGFGFIYLKLPETKNKTLEDLERELVDK